MLASSGVSALVAACLVGLHVSSVFGAIDPLIAPRTSDETTNLDFGAIPMLDSFHGALGTTPDDWTVEDIQFKQEEVDVEKAESTKNVILGDQLPATKPRHQPAQERHVFGLVALHLERMPQQALFCRRHGRQVRQRCLQGYREVAFMYLSRVGHDPRHTRCPTDDLSSERQAKGEAIGDVTLRRRVCASIALPSCTLAWAKRPRHHHAFPLQRSAVSCHHRFRPKTHEATFPPPAVTVRARMPHPVRLHQRDLNEPRICTLPTS